MMLFLEELLNMHPALLKSHQEMTDSLWCADTSYSFQAVSSLRI